jgi:hypothetical protein
MSSVGPERTACPGRDATSSLAAGLFAVAPTHVYWTAMLFTESLFTLGVAATLAVSLWAGERRTPAAYFVAGLTLIATAFVRSQALVLVVPCAVLLLRQWSPREAVRVAAPAAVACALLLVPWTIRNEIAMGRPYPINNSLGYNLRWAHGPDSQAGSVAPQDLWDERPGISFHERELFFDDEGRKRAIEYALDHPGWEARMALRRIGYMFESDAEAAVQWSETHGRTPLESGARGLFILLGDAFWYPVALLALASIVALPRTRMAWALWSAGGMWLLLHIIFAGEPRYHVPMLPVIVVLAAATLARAYDALREDGAGR